MKRMYHVDIDKKSMTVSSTLFTKKVHSTIINAVEVVHINV